MSENRHTKNFDPVPRHFQNDAPHAEAHEHIAFEEEMRRANEYIQVAVQTIRMYDLPQATEPAFQFRLLF